MPFDYLFTFKEVKNILPIVAKILISKRKMKIIQWRSFNTISVMDAQVKKRNPLRSYLISQMII